MYYWLYGLKLIEVSLINLGESKVTMVAKTTKNKMFLYLGCVHFGSFYSIGCSLETSCLDVHWLATHANLSRS